MIIRTLFGNVLDRKPNESMTIWEADLLSLESFSLKHDFEVYTWGRHNHNFLQDRGYTSILMSEFPYIANVSTARTENYITKFISIREAIKRHGRALFLDWDTHVVDNINDSIYDNLTGSIKVPLYTFEERWATNRGIINELHTPLLKSWILDINSEKYSVWPCGSFIYCDDLNEINLIINIFKQTFWPWVHTKEETTLQQYFNYKMNGDFSLESYSTQFEPIYAHGQVDDAMDGSEIYFNEYYRTITPVKDIKFEHRSDLGWSVYNGEVSV